MVTIMANKISDYILGKVDVDEITREKFIYSVKYIMNQIFYYIGLFTVLGLLAIYNSNMAVCGVVYICMFHLNRKFFGGFHFDNPRTCYVMSMLVPIGCGILGGLWLNYSMYLLLIYIPYILAILKFGVVDHPNKRLPDKWKNRLFKKGLIMMCVIIIAHVLVRPYQFLFIPMFLSIVTTTISLIIGHFYNNK